MRYDRQVIGYHACRKEVADRLLDGESFRFGVERGLLNPDGSPKLPESDPCVTIVR
jgi:hypothetical protein